MIAIRELLQECLWTAAEAQAKYYNKSHMAKTYNVGDMVLLSTKTIKLARPSKKLDYCFAGPFRVLDLIGKQVYRLDIPKSWKRVHLVFHVSLLEPYHSRPEAGQPTVLEPVLFPDREEWEVEKILDKYTQKGKKQYLIRWLGFGPMEDSWQSEMDIQNAGQALRQYRLEHTAAFPHKKCMHSVSLTNTTIA